MPKKPDKFGIKFLMVVDTETKYLNNGFSYLGKDKARDTFVSLATHVMMKIMQLIFKRGFKVTCENVFTSLDLICVLRNKNVYSIDGTARQNRRKLPPSSKKKKQKLLESFLFTRAQLDSTVLLTFYQCKMVVLMRKIHSDAEIPSHKNSKKNPKTVLFYSTIKRNLGLTSLIKWLENTQKGWK